MRAYKPEKSDVAVHVKVHISITTIIVIITHPSLPLHAVLVQSKYSLTPKKLLQKLFQLILLGFSVLYNILKVYQNRSLRKVLFSRWRPICPPKPSNGHKSVTINSKLMILVSIPMFLGARNTLRP